MAKGDGCKQEPGVFAPVIDRASCEGKADCVVVCPCDCFREGEQMLFIAELDLGEL